MSKEKVLKVNEYSKWNQPETPETNINELNIAVSIIFS